MKEWVKRIGLGVISLILLLLVSGAAYQFVCTKMDERAYPPPGKLVDVGGYRLHINCSGEGRPAVILDAGMGCNSLDWTLVQPEIAKFTRVCSYDRAGNGWSDESPLERTSQNIVEELHVLLQNADEKGPYILVGHSFGGLNFRLYASKYPEEVAGVVFVESSHEGQLEEPDAYPQSLIEELLTHPKVAAFCALIGIFRILNHFPAAKEDYKELPPDIQQMYLAATCTRKYVCAVVQESEKFNRSLKQVKSARNHLDDKLLIVVKAGKLSSSEESGYSRELADKLDKNWEAYQKDLVAKSIRGKQLIAERSGHRVPHEQPEIIVDAVREVSAEREMLGR